MFDADRLTRLARVSAGAGLSCAPFLEANAGEYELSSPLRCAHFIAQLCYESLSFTRLSEDLDYTADRIAQVWPRLAGRAAVLAHDPEGLGNAAYASRLGNGSETSGDGWMFRGRGLIQLTGRSNYRTRGAAIGLELEPHPDLASMPATAAECALSYWQAKGCNQAADADDVGRVTRLIAGSEDGLAMRTDLTQRAKQIFV